MKDIYLYEGSDVMINKLNIKDKDYLERAEADITYIKMLDVDRVTINGEFDIKHLLKIHRYIFEDIYDWAGEIRKINIEKAEKVLDGYSVEYGDYSVIHKKIEEILYLLKKVKWNDLSIKEKLKKYSLITARLWQIHPFREGNTRTIIVFMTQYAIVNGFYIDRALFKSKSKYLREALLMASLGQYSDISYLVDIFSNSIRNKDIIN